MATFHGKCFKINRVNQLDDLKLSRDQFLDKDLKASVAKKVAKGLDTLFLSNDITQTFKKERYQLIMHGVLPCGSKTTVTINGIDPHVDIRLLEGEEAPACKARINRLIEAIGEKASRPTRIEFESGKDFLYFDHNSYSYARIYFSSLKGREEFIGVCKDFEIKTYSNDKSSYHRVVSRSYEINLSGWNVLTNYGRDFKSKSKAAYSLVIDVKDLKPMLDDDATHKAALDQEIDPSVVKYENMIVSGFDIEMIPENPDRFPDADSNPKDSIFMICMTYHFTKKEKSILSVCLTLKEADPLDDVLMIYCESEACLLAAFARFMSYMQPDFITEFNGGGFDWRNIITKARILGVLSAFLEDMSLVRLLHWEKSANMLNRFHRECNIKIGGATADAICKGLKMQGFVGFDTLVVFKQLEPNADSHRLNECLRRCNLGSKDDMDIKEMFRIYRHGTSEEMKLVAHYCFVDTFKLQLLLLKKNVIQDRREVANLSYTSIYDNFFFAGGSRMRNLLMNRGAKLGYFFDTTYRPTIEDPEAKFPGAFVVPPIKGIVKPMLRIDEYLQTNHIVYSEDNLCDAYEFIESNFDQMYHSDDTLDCDNAPPIVKSYMEYAGNTKNQYPISGLDFASLYPSLIMAYNISPEKLIVDEEYAKDLQSQGYQIKHVSFPFCGKTVNGWFVRHENNEDNISICGKLLIELFAKRAALKKVLKHLGEQIFEMEMEMKPFLERDALCEYPRIEEYNEVKFDHASCDSKQKAVKIFMNTLYGEMGNFVSCICAVEVAASVTTMGRYNLRLIKTFVEDELKMTVYYGDTDSLYVACNPIYFAQYDREYFTGKIDKVAYGTNLVEETFRQIETAKHLVNQHLIENNGTKYLKMAYEEVLYPCAFLGKKKYYGVPHEENVDFYPRKLFLRGLEIVKRGASEVLKDVINEVIREVMDIKTTRDIVDIIKDAISRVFSSSWSVNDFAKTKSYRPDKKNPSVIRMMERYRSINYHSIPEPNVRFKYVICKYYPWEYDIQGRQQNELKIGDRMELITRVNEENLPIDLEYYFDNELTGQFARLITFLDQFNDNIVEPEDIDTSEMDNIEIDALDKEIYKKAEDALYKKAKKYIGQLAKQYSKAYINKGVLFKDTWSQVSNFIYARKDLQSFHLRGIPSIVLDMFVGSGDNLNQTLLQWAIRHIAYKYQTTLSDEQTQVLDTQLKSIIKFIHKENLQAPLTNCISTWTKNVVAFIREEYDYEYICKNNLPYTTIWDVVTRQELEIILSDTSLFPAITPDQCKVIVDRVSSAISNSLTVDQLCTM